MAATTTTALGIKLPAAAARIFSPFIESPIHPSAFPPGLFLQNAGCSDKIKSTCPLLRLFPTQKCNLLHIVSCLPPSQPPSTAGVTPSTKLYISGLSFHTTEESLTNAFKIFGRLLEVNLVMDKIAKRPKGFAFVRYATVEESQKAIEGMHGKFLDGRVIFVEFSKPRSQVRYGNKQIHNELQIRDV